MKIFTKFIPEFILQNKLNVKEYASYLENSDYLFYRVFDNERNKELIYHFGQKDAYDVGHVANKFSNIYILIFGF